MGGAFLQRRTILISEDLIIVSEFSSCVMCGCSEQGAMFLWGQLFWATLVNPHLDDGNCAPQLFVYTWTSSQNNG